MPEDEIFDDPNMNEMLMNPDLYGVEENEEDKIVDEDCCFSEKVNKVTNVYYT